MRMFYNFLKPLFIVLLLTSGFACQKESPVTDPPNPPTISFSVSVIQDEFQGVPVVVAGSDNLGFVVAFERTLPDGTMLDFEPTTELLPIILRDQQGNSWDLWGNAVDGPLEGNSLTPAHSMMGYWFVFGAMYPGVEIYKGAANPVTITTENGKDWLIPTDHVFQGSGFDAIQAIDDPPFVTYDFRTDPQGEFYLQDEDLVIGLKIGEEVRLYPHPVLDWHEIVNDEIGEKAVAVVYCPLTGTATAWDRRLSNGMSTFGVSGLLYNNNVLPFDRATNSIWTQLEGRCVRGALAGEIIGRYPLVEMPWRTWKAIYRQPVVLSPETGFDRDYRQYPYGDYRTNHNFLAYPIAYDDERLPRKERVFALIINGKAKVFPLNTF